MSHGTDDPRPDPPDTPAGPDAPTAQDLPRDAAETAGKSARQARRIVGTLRAARYPVFEAMKGGLPNYWYPVMRARSVPKRVPKAITVLGEKIMLVREGGSIHALADRCPHRGVPLSIGRRWEFMPGGGRREFPGTFTCAYHGWTYDLCTGRLVAALTDGPAAAIVRNGGVAVRTYPVAVRSGIVWIWVGDHDPVPVEEDIPPRYRHADNVIVSWFRIRDGNWRDAAENGYDLGHFYYLHRTAFGYLFSRRDYPVGMVPRKPLLSEDGSEIDFMVAGWGKAELDFPGLGRWPPRAPWVFGIGRLMRRYSGRPATSVAMGTPFRRPAVLEVQGWPHRGMTHFEWYVPVDDDHYIYFQNFVIRTSSRVRAAAFRLWYWAWGRWVWHHNFNSQDFAMVAAIDASNPEILFRPDSAIRQLRRFIEADPRWPGGQ